MTTSKLKININRIILIKSVFLLIILCLALYVYLINVIVFDIVQKETIVNQITVTDSEIHQLESILIDKKMSINKSLAQNFGLVQEMENKMVFVSKDANTRLTFNE